MMSDEEIGPGSGEAERIELLCGRLYAAIGDERCMVLEALHTTQLLLSALVV